MSICVAIGSGFERSLTERPVFQGGVNHILESDTNRDIERDRGKRKQQETSSLQVGDGIEIQWRRQPTHPFGWYMFDSGLFTRINLFIDSLLRRLRYDIKITPWMCRWFGKVLRIWADVRKETGQVVLALFYRTKTSQKKRAAYRIDI